MSPIDPRHATYVVIAAALALGVLLFLVATAVRRAFTRFRLRARMAHAARGEDHAEGLLVGRGYAILGRQCAGSWEVMLDGASTTIALRADYLVARGGRRFVAEVKTGRVAPRIESAATRRQLLEYRFAFDVDGVLLVDAERDRVSEVVFAAAPPPQTREPPAGGGGAWWMIACAVGIACAATFVVATLFGCSRPSVGTSVGARVGTMTIATTAPPPPPTSTETPRQTVPAWQHLVVLVKSDADAAPLP